MNTFPTAWSVELVRNPSGRAFWFVSRFASRTRLDYVEDVTGQPKCFRLERQANAAVVERNAPPHGAMSNATAVGRAITSQLEL